ncbi:glucan biosynthesis protein G [Acetobacter indonesiensis NRIC 0313]|jgi:glucans biosynthesis protein|uniref:Glucan biosynthesis periplasmic protein MdoG n=1 Tax=Acetobacter indonesiensis TaxID=104101 RepID=A0A6N3T445_9PROT|nr:glucan biosynthesis protein G [Acetobacter indonesiensis]GAN64329.1 glucan biosynthesis periplasmic protein MdoG [Acetobacter indonesiensis]GBQ52735.1 glucan biosynthesis protein G [Acetobacter indonesiensis NRIC 0313]GEN03205.1 glucans biosynthesis protein G [Acetobacter indonesiensis]
MPSNNGMREIGVSSSIQRRDLMKVGAGATLASLASGVVSKARAEGLNGATGAFDDGTVRQIAKQLASAPYKAPDQSLPKAIDNLNFDQFRSIAYREEKALWHGENLAFDAEFFPRGFLYRPRIEIYEVKDGQAAAVPYTPDLFSYGDPSLQVTDDLGFAGLRLRTAINTPNVMEEFCVFLGASYFRAVGKGQNYGLSARGFADGTGDPKGEEFALFRAFWLEKPQPNVQSIVIHALLDSPSVAGAFRFTIRPGDTTVFDVQSTLFPRTKISQSGIAPLTGMFYFDANDHNHVDDWRPAAHDSEALQMWTGSGQQLFRPLRNPLDLQFSAFNDVSPRGFGLMQRRRNFRDFEDLALNYEKRPSLWIEPIGDWGEGWVDLVEIPTPNEVNDNIVSFWRPKTPLAAGKEYSFTYRMYWGWDNPFPTSLARIGATRVGSVVDDKNARFFAIDFMGSPFDHLPKDTHFHLVPQASVGTIRNVVVEPNPNINGWRTTFEFVPGDEKLAELRCVLASDNGPVSEEWLYRWTP